MAGKGSSDGKQPIIIKKVNKGHGGHHGGAWKVAFADFTTAMMAFFLLLWLLGSISAEQKAAISKYFTDPGGTFMGEGGANASLIELGEPKLPTSQDVPEVLAPGAQADTEQEGSEDSEARQKKLEDAENKALSQLKDKMIDMVNSNMAFSDFKDQVLIDITPEGLRIQFVDKEGRPMFDSASSQMKFYSIAILNNMAKLIAQVPNRVSITGHTDSQPFIGGEEGFGNWELSTARANSARRALVNGGLNEKQIARVEGFADSALFNESDPNDPQNRRIAIIVLKKRIDDALKSNALGKFVEDNFKTTPVEDITPPMDVVPDGG